MTEEVKEKIQLEEAKMVRIIEATKAILNSKEWSTLKIELFDNIVSVLEKELKIEAERPEPNPHKLNRITGNLEWARKYSSLEKLENEYRVKLQNVRIQLHGKTTE